MKLIDADALKQAILTTMPERSEVLLIVDNQPDAVVRCKDCRKRGTVMCHLWFNSPIPKDSWYCADGERK